MLLVVIRDHVVEDIVVAILIHVRHVIVLRLRFCQFPVIGVAVVIPFWIITVFVHFVESSVSIWVPHGQVMEFESVFGMNVIFVVSVRVKVVMVVGGVVT